MNDLEVGREVPSEELERLMPPLEIPDEPATIEQATEQGAKDAALYFAQLSQVAHQRRSSEALKSINWDQCGNCSALMEAIDSPGASSAVYSKSLQKHVVEIERYPDTYPVYRARVDTSWARLVLVDLETNKIEINDSAVDSQLYYGVTFYDGRWRPLYMNMTEEPEIG